MVRIEFATDNAAFEEAPATEAARILKAIARQIETGAAFDGTIYDINGNRVGAWSMDEPEESEGC